MKKALLIIAFLGVVLTLVAQESPTVRFGGALSTGVNYFASTNPSTKPLVYAWDNSQAGWGSPLKIDFYGDANAGTWGYHFDLTNSYNHGTDYLQGFQLWSAYGWTRGGDFTLVAGQLDEFDFHDWINYQNYLGRDKFGSFGVALKYQTGRLKAMVEVPVGSPKLPLSSTPFLYFGSPKFSSQGSTKVVGLDGTAAAVGQSLYAALTYDLEGLGSVLVGYQGQGLNTGSYYNGSNLWADLKVSTFDELIALVEFEGFNIGAVDTQGKPIDAVAYNLLGRVGWKAPWGTVESKVGYLVADSTVADQFNLFVLPSVSIPLQGGLTAVFASRVDNILGKAAAPNSTGKTAFWVNPELQVAVGHNQIALGAYAGNDDNGGLNNGFFGFPSAAVGSDTNGNPRYFVNLYTTFVYWF